MISVKKWPYILIGTILSLALWTFISVNTGMFETDEVFEYATYITSYILVIGFWGLFVLKLDISEGLRKAISASMVVLTPFFCMQIAMILSQAAEYSFGIYFINIMFYFVIMAIFIAVTQSFTVSAVVTIIISFIFNMACFVVNVLRGTPLIPSDFLAIGTAAHVAENYTFHMEYPIIAATVVAALSVILILKFPMKVKFRFKHVILPVCGILTAVIFFVSLAAIDYTNVEMDFFDQHHANNTHGTIYSFYINVRRMLLQKPDEYDEGKTEQLLNDYSPSQSGEIEDKPNIIVIMNESFSDLHAIGSFETNIDYMPNIRKLEKNTIKGEMLVSPFGGYTCNTEFEFLTGLTMGLLPSGSTPYLQYISKPYNYALPSYLHDIGYKSVAIHPYYAHCWNRNKVYDFLGFDEFFSLENFNKLVPEDEWEEMRFYMSDRTSFEAIKKRLEKKNENERLFIFNVTMQNHGGYYYGGPEFPTVTITDMDGHYSETEQYLSLVRESDKAFEEFIDELRDIDEHTIVVMFGDHQPAVEQEFFEELYGKPLERLSVYELQQRYKVPFVIWANYDIDEATEIETSTNYLSDLILNTAGIPKNSIGNFTENLHAEIPQINAMGHFDSNGEWFENDTSESDMLKEYADIEYYSLTKKDK